MACHIRSSHGSHCQAFQSRAAHQRQTLSTPAAAAGWVGGGGGGSAAAATRATRPARRRPLVSRPILLWHGALTLSARPDQPPLSRRARALARLGWWSGGLVVGGGGGGGAPSRAAWTRRRRAAPRQITETEFFLVYYDIFVRNAFGNYRDVLREVGVSRARRERRMRRRHDPTTHACHERRGATDVRRVTSTTARPTTTRVRHERRHDQHACRTKSGDDPSRHQPRRMPNHARGRGGVPPFFTRTTTTTTSHDSSPSSFVLCTCPLVPPPRGLVLADDGVLPDVPPGHELRVPGVVWATTHGSSSS